MSSRGREGTPGGVGSRVAKKVLVLLALVLATWASGQGGPQEPSDVGYVEGRIIDIDTSTRTALVETAGGRVLEAEVPDHSAFPETEDLPEFEVGQRVELYYSGSPEGGTSYVVADWVRRPALLSLLALFFLVSVVIGRGKGLRAFIATSASLAIAVAFVVPAILAGWDPVLISLLGTGGMLLLAIYFVHGFNWSTSAATAGTFVAVIATMLLGIFFSDLAHLTGFGSEEAMMINVGAEQINLRGLMLAGLLIGALGALTDITIVQASVVRELAHVNPDFSWRELYGRGMNVGLDHVGSLVDTLVLAYTGAALPLLVLLNLSDFGVARSLNIELVAAEVVHTLVGAIGLILAVPVTTFIAAFLFRGDRLPVAKGELDHAHHHH